MTGTAAVINTNYKAITGRYRGLLLRSQGIAQHQLFYS